EGVLELLGVRCATRAACHVCEIASEQAHACRGVQSSGAACAVARAEPLDETSPDRWQRLLAQNGSRRWLVPSEQPRLDLRDASRVPEGTSESFGHLATAPVFVCRLRSVRVEPRSCDLHGRVDSPEVREPLQRPRELLAAAFELLLPQ